jgi:flagellar basal-body rod protein FlgB
MTEGLEAITTASLRHALDVASLRQQVIASNIANAGSAGYARQSVSFAAQLDQLGDDGLPRIVEARNADGTPEQVRLDIEMADMSQNTLQYQALLKALSRHYAILSSAISDGRK